MSSIDAQKKSPYWAVLCSCFFVVAMEKETLAGVVLVGDAAAVAWATSILEQLQASADCKGRTDLNDIWNGVVNNDSHTATIRILNGGISVTPAWTHPIGAEDDVYNGTGADTATILYLNDKGNTLLGDINGQPCQRDVGATLVHELAHVFRFSQGNVLTGPWQSPLDDAEQYAATIENIYRRNNNLCIDAGYNQWPLPPSATEPCCDQIISGAGNPQQLCNGDCVDTRVDRQNCGLCGYSCGSNEVCSSGVCTCPTADGVLTMCAAGCVDLMTDMKNCGRCGFECSSVYTSCNGGVCSCQLGTASNCAYCGNACASPLGVCRDFGWIAQYGGEMIVCACPETMDLCHTDSCVQMCRNANSDGTVWWACPLVPNGGCP